MQSNILQHPRKDAFKKRNAQRQHANLDRALCTVVKNFRCEVAELQESFAVPEYEVQAQRDGNLIHLFLTKEFGFYQNPGVRAVGLSTISQTNSSQTDTYLRLDEEYIPVDLNEEVPNTLLQARRALDKTLHQEYQAHQAKLEEIFSRRAPKPTITCKGAGVLNAYQRLKEDSFEKQTLSLPDIIHYTPKQ